MTGLFNGPWDSATGPVPARRSSRSRGQLTSALSEPSLFVFLDRRVKQVPTAEGSKLGDGLSKSARSEAIRRLVERGLKAS
jgi:hypothetical protein